MYNSSMAGNCRAGFRDFEFVNNPGTVSTLTRPGIKGSTKGCCKRCQEHCCWMRVSAGCGFVRLSVFRRPGSSFVIILAPAGSCQSAVVSGMCRLRTSAGYAQRHRPPSCCGPCSGSSGTVQHHIVIRPCPKLSKPVTNPHHRGVFPNSLPQTTVCWCCA